MIDKTIKILIAEDEYLISEDIIRGLKALGYDNFIEVADGEEAFEKTCSLRPDVVLMDIKMPKIDGIEATRKIQESCPTPVVIITAYESEDLLANAGAAGVSAFLTKPPHPDEIERAIVIALARNADLMEVRRLNKELKQALAEVKTLRGIIPICSYCKKIRDDQGYWKQLEAYLHSHSEVQFTHGACPECFKEQMDELNKLK